MILNSLFDYLVALFWCVRFQYITKSIITWMKVIKNLKQQSPSYRLRILFQTMPPITKFLLISSILVSIGLSVVDSPRGFNWWCFIDIRPYIEMVLFLVVAVTDLSNQQRKGSIFFLITFLIKICMIPCASQVLSLIESLFSSNSSATTSYPLLYCLFLGFRDMISRPGQQRYFLISPFKIKFLFYPILISLILQAISFRLDIFGSLFMSAVTTGFRVDSIFIRLSKKLDCLLSAQIAERTGLVLTGSQDTQTIQKVEINRSVLDQS